MLTHAENLDWPLMRNNISRADLDVVIEFLRQDDPILTQSKQVQAFEQEWSDWVGVKYSVFLNSGSSTNLATLTALREAGSEEVKRAYREKHPDLELSQKMMDTLRRHGVEFRRGTAGGGNQLRQPYLRKLFLETDFENYPNVDHVHFYGVYLGNYSELEKAKISKLCSILNRLPGTR